MTALRMLVSPKSSGFTSLMGIHRASAASSAAVMVGMSPCRGTKKSISSV